MSSAHSKKAIKSQADAGTGELFLVATPIGNLKDITLRALEILKQADLIACEDTRTSAVLLRHYGIDVPTAAYHAHNEASISIQLVERLREGARIALISDAGTPLLSDPGARLVRAAIEAGVRVTPIPGASALLAAISVAGLSAEAFFFAGFLPPKPGARQKAIAALVPIPGTLVFYEAPHRLEESLEALAEGLGDRQAAVARELTKRHEECVRGSLSELAIYYREHPPKGECVVLVEEAAKTVMDEATVDAKLRTALAEHSLREAVQHVTAESGLPRSEVYARALALKEGDGNA